MYKIKTKNISCPNCNQLISPDERHCPHCQADLAIAAVIAERVMTTAPLFPTHRPTTPEMLVPRIGEYLVEQGHISPAQLDRALLIQKKMARSGEAMLVGELLVELGCINRETLDQAITQHVLQLQEALTHSNQRLEEQVQQRTSQLQNALIKLSELNQLKLNFISNVSHELRTPMQFLIGYLDLFANGSLGPVSNEQGAALDSLQRAGQQLKGLIENLLQFSSAANGELPLNMTPLTLDLPVRTAVTASRPKAQARSVNLRKYLASQLPKVSADNEKITWVVEQFLDNAIKFTPAGGKVEIETIHQQQDVVVKVTDTGIGIPDGRINEIFEPFHQLDGSSTRHYGGTGLGLALARSIIETHGSEIYVESYPGQGSSFSFALPVLN
ncbi:MAG: ATP-binding protein [Anaerolineae bacterium]